MCAAKFIYWVYDTCDLLQTHEYSFININIYNETNGKYSHNDTLKMQCNDRILLRTTLLRNFTDQEGNKSVTTSYNDEMYNKVYIIRGYVKMSMSDKNLIAFVFFLTPSPLKTKVTKH